MIHLMVIYWTSELCLPVVRFSATVADTADVEEDEELDMTSPDHGAGETGVTYCPHCLLIITPYGRGQGVG